MLMDEFLYPEKWDDSISLTLSGSSMITYMS